MGRRCIDTVKINGNTYNLGKINDLSFLDNYTTFGDYNNLNFTFNVTGDNFVNVESSVSSTTQFDTNLSDTLKFKRWVDGSTKRLNFCITDYEYNNFRTDNWITVETSGWRVTPAYFCFVVDDSTGEGWILLQAYENVGGNWLKNMGYSQATYRAFAVKISANGGGATSVAKVTGKLKELSSNLSDIIMVSGGGGGGYIIGEDVYPGADAGGISGNGPFSGNQSTGYAFGQGESGSNVSGGGSGLYGGYTN